jgi:hypothetical protein
MAKKSKRLGIHKILQDKEEIKALVEAGRPPENEKFLKDRDNDPSLIQLVEEEFEGDLVIDE